MIKTAIIHATCGPYHLVRAKALTRVKDIHPAFIELTREQQSHPWEVNKQSCQVPLITLSELPFKRCRSQDLSQALEKTLEGIDPDVVVSTGYGVSVMRTAARWARAHGKGSIFFHTSTRWDRPRYWIKEAVKGWIVRRYYDAAFVGGSRHREYLVQLGMPTERVWEPYDVVDNNHFSRLAAVVRTASEVWRSRLKLPNRYFLYVGRYAPEKNLFRLLDAYRRYRVKYAEGWSLVLVGNGSQRKELEAFTKGHSIRDVFFVGFQQIDELPAYYALSSCFVLPSISEPWGLVVNEAMACTLPVLVSKQCGCVPELVHEGENGFTFDPYDTEAMAELLGRMTVLDESRRLAMGTMSQAVITRYTPQVWAENLAKCIRAVVAKG